MDSREGGQGRHFLNKKTDQLFLKIEPKTLFEMGAPKKYKLLQINLGSLLK